MAALCGNVEIVRLLLKMGGGAFAQHAVGRFALHCAAAGGHVETARLLVQELGGGALAARNEINGDTPLHKAAEMGHAETVRALVEMGSDVHMEVLFRWNDGLHTVCIWLLVKGTWKGGWQCRIGRVSGRRRTQGL